MSHLSTLIERAKRCARAGCTEQEDCGAGEVIAQALQERLVNLAEYMTYSHDYDQREAAEAAELLWRHGMQSLICNPEAITGFLGGDRGLVGVPMAAKPMGQVVKPVEVVA